MKTTRIALLAAGTAAALALAACSGSKDEDQRATGTNAENMTAIEPDNAATVSSEAPAAPRIDNATTESRPAPPTLSSSESTQDDADATGMTARVSRDEGSNAAQPAQ
jgi:hypothetical protein